MTSQATKIPVNLDFLKIFAIVSMVIDHVHFIWFARAWEPVRWIGLFAFPLFCFILSYNYLYHSSDKPGLLKRLLAFIFISQVPYQWAFDLPLSMPGLSIFVTLFLGISIVALFESWKHPFNFYVMIVVCAGLLGFEYWSEQQYSWIFDGGISGIVLVPGCYLFLRSEPAFKVIGWLFALAALYILDNVACSFSIGALFVAYFVSGKIPWDFSFMRGHKMFFYWFYPAHLFLIKFFLILIPMYVQHIYK